MQLKRYQERVLEEVRTYLQALARERDSGHPLHAAQDAWDSLRLPRRYRERRNGAGKDLPTFCIKVPTGGGKTLLATQIVGQAHKALLPDRNGAGLVLWVVPSDQIYKDTLKALRDRTHFYRESLEFAVSRRIEVWEKSDIARLTPARLASALNILIVKLQGTNRQDRESLKFFRDSGGNIVQHFPPEDEPEKHRALKERVPNLDMLEEDPGKGSYLARTSIGNLVRLCEPVVILDEGHKATSELARQTLEGFNPSLVVELSATPQREANVLSQVSGAELLDEEMIKLPINVSNSRQTSWQNCLTQARDKREELAARALEQYRGGNPLIRPIVLVQVERTGKDQRDPQYIHSEDVREYLVSRLAIPAERVKVKTSERDDIEGLDLLADECPVEWIITKAALQEGWDCPFAYILVSLSNTRSKQSMTQLVGRVLRQPFVQKTPYPELNESYVFCLRQHAADVVKDVRAALQNEGYEGESVSVVDRTDSGETGAATRTAMMKPLFQSFYRQPFEGRIFLPRFCVKTGEEYEGLDYFGHLLAGVRVEQFDYERVKGWDLSHDLRQAKEQFYQIFLNEEALEPIHLRETALAAVEADPEARAWLVANLGIDWLSAKRLRTIVDSVCDRLEEVRGSLALVRFPLLQRMSAFVQEETDRQTEAAFRALNEQGRLLFYLECVECRFEIPASVERRRIRMLRHRDDTDLQKSLFDYEPNELNEYEKDVALYLDRRDEVLWWYRNIVGHEEFSIQGPRRQKIYPDYVVQEKWEGREDQQRPTVWLIESKGAHLKGSMDTEYKRDVARYFEELGTQVTWQQLGEGFDEHRFRFQVLDQGDYSNQEWRDKLNRLFAEA